MQFRKKPVVIEAYLWGNTYVDVNGTTIISHDEPPPWLITAMINGVVYPFEPKEGCIPELMIRTLEGEMKVKVGNWIIQGVNGELYSCDPDIFEKTYERL